MFYVNTTLDTYNEDTVIGLAGAYKFMYECEIEWGKLCTALSIAQVLNEHGIEYDGGILLEADGTDQAAAQPTTQDDGTNTATTGDQGGEPDGDTHDSKEPAEKKKPNIIMRFLLAIRDFFRKLFKKSNEVVQKAQVVQKVRLKKLGQFWAQYGKDIMALSNGKTVNGNSLQSYGPFNGYEFTNLDSNIENVDKAIQNIGKSVVSKWHPIRNRDGAFNEDRYNQEMNNMRNAVLQAVGAPNEGEDFDAKVKAGMFGAQKEIDTQTVARALMRINPADENNYEAAQKKVGEYTQKFTNVMHQLESTIDESIKMVKEGEQLNKHDQAVNIKAKIFGECAKMIGHINTLYNSAYQVRLKQVYQWAIQCIGHGTENMDDETGEDAKSDYNRAAQAKAAEGEAVPEPV